MRYVVELNGERRDVELDGSTAKLGQVELNVDLETIEGTPIRVVTIGDEVHRVVVRRRDGRGAYTLWVDGFRFEVDALDERARTIRDIAAAASKPTGPAPIVAPMPGLVVRVNVAVGDTIAVGHGAIVMEAMKMENELRATTGGRVKAVHAEVGAAVEKGEVLVELE
ncbi:MAG: biotin/lipoyl-containing protein [Gemmatimonadaceae bacterium]